MASTITIDGGTEKQNAWASEIATQWLKDLDREIATVADRNTLGDRLEWYSAALDAARIKALEGFVNVTSKQVIDMKTLGRNPIAMLIKKARDTKPS